MANAVHLAIMRILQPLARLLVSQGVSYGQVGEMLKTAMVRAAFERAKHGPTQPGTTASTVSVATGIHRKDIKRLREQLWNMTDRQADKILADLRSQQRR